LLSGYFGIALVTGGQTNWSLISQGVKFQILAQVLYGIGYSFPYTLEIASATINCDQRDLDKVGPLGIL
jgi:hypothetical protein